MDTFSAITWNVYAGSSPDALEPHLIRQCKKGVSVALLQEAGGRGLPTLFRNHGMRFFAHGQYAVAWDPEVWPHVIRKRGFTLSDNTYFHFGKNEQVTTECAEVILCNDAGRTLTALSYHTPAKVQSRDGEPERVEERIRVTMEAHRKVGKLAAESQTCGFLAGGDDNWDEDTGHQVPYKLVKEILLGGSTGMRQLQAGKPTFGKREIDDFRIPIKGLLVPVGDPWVMEGGGEEKPNHKIHGREFGWRS